MLGPETWERFRGLGIVIPTGRYPPSPARGRPIRGAIDNYVGCASLFWILTILGRAEGKPFALAKGCQTSNPALKLTLELRRKQLPMVQARNAEALLLGRLPPGLRR